VRARIVIAVALVAALAGCQESGFDEARETQRPLKVQHALDPMTGTRVPGVAKRPLPLTPDTLGDTVLLAVRPVAAGLSPGARPEYLRPALRDVRVVRFDDLAALEAADPDVILGSKELEEGLYDDLRKIAPTIMSEGYDWKLNLRLHGEALGRTNDAEQLLVDWDNRVAEVRDAIGDANVSVVLSAAGDSEVREFATGPESFAGKLLAELGLELGNGGDRVIRVTGGQEWLGRGGLLGARNALADVARSL
jgi:iron complex transport system substrate-binding protein